MPGDELSLQNGILTVHALRYPLCIDPQQQALRWILNMENQNNLKTVSLNQLGYIQQLERAIKYAYPIVFVDIGEYVDPVIFAYLEENNKGNYDFST